MNISQDGLRFIIAQEGEVLKVYRDQAGFATIGVGHKLTPSELTSGKLRINGAAVRYAGGLTREQAQDLLGQDVQHFCLAVERMVSVPLAQNQFEALVDFAFNCGEGALLGSTLLKLLNQGNYAAVPEQLRRWIHAGGRIVGALVRRREAEVKLWLGKG